MKYLIDGKYVDKETYRKHLEAERAKLAKEQEPVKTPAKEGGK